MRDCEDAIAFLFWSTGNLFQFIILFSKSACMIFLALQSWANFHHLFPDIISMTSLCWGIFCEFNKLRCNYWEIKGDIFLSSKIFWRNDNLQMCIKQSKINRKCFFKGFPFWKSIALIKNETEQKVVKKIYFSLITRIKYLHTDKTTLSEIRNLPQTCLLFLHISIHYTGLNLENIL